METNFLLVIYPELPPINGGMQVHGAEFIKFLVKKKINFIALTNEINLEKNQIDEIDEINGFTPIRLLKRNNFVRNLEIIEGICKSIKPTAVFSSHVAFKPACKNTKFVSRSAGNDILRPWLGPNNISYKKIKSLPIEEQRFLLAENRKWVLNAALECDVIVCNSSWTQSKLSELGIENTVVLSGGVDTNRFRPISDLLCEKKLLNIPENKKIATIAARHVLKKGIDTAIEAFDLLKDKNEFHLIIIGEGPETKNLESIRQELNLDNVSFFGELPHSILHNYLACSDVVLLPSRNIYDPRKFAYDIETMGRIACEASSCGVPVIGSNVGGIPSVVIEDVTGSLTKANCPDSLANSITSLFNNPKKVNDIKKLSREFALNHFCFTKVNEKTLNYIL